MLKDKWSITNSLWILVTFTFYFYWIAFFYAGITAKSRKWILYGLIYAIPFILYQIFPASGPNPSNLSMSISLAFFIFWIVSIIHAFKIRKEYLIRLKYVKESKETDEYLKEK